MGGTASIQQRYHTTPMKVPIELPTHTHHHAHQNNKQPIQQKEQQANNNATSVHVNKKWNVTVDFHRQLVSIINNSQHSLPYVILCPYLLLYA